MNIAGLKNRIEIWGKSPTTNELGEADYDDTELKTIWAEIIPQTGSLQRQQTNTILSNTTHKIICRYSAGKDIKTDMWIMYKGHRFDIKYILNPYFSNESLEIFCEEVVE